jgi:hypothetical protein
MSEPIVAELVGSDHCHAGGLAVRAYAPALEMCRRLLAAGFHSDRPLHAYRGGTLALTVTSIGWGARHTVEDTHGTPRLRRYRAGRSTGAAPPVDYSEPPALSAVPR